MNNCTGARPAPTAAARAAQPPRPVARRALPAAELLQLAAAGDVDAPPGVLIGAAVLITVVATAIIPIALKPGDDAAQKIFAAKEKRPLDKKKR